MQAERSVDGSGTFVTVCRNADPKLSSLPSLGLIILEATYGAVQRDDYTEGLEIDVTIPLQALVIKSQLYIPGKRSKVSSNLPCFEGPFSLDMYPVRVVPRSQLPLGTCARIA